MRHVSAAIVLAALCGGSAWAQEEGDRFRTALSVVGGLSVGSSGSFGLSDGLFGLASRGSDAGFAVGAGVARDLSPRVTVEATGLYLDRGTSAWSADAGFRLNLTPSGKPIVPYFAASGGVYSERSSTAALRGRSFEDERDLFNFLEAVGGPALPGRRDASNAAGTLRADRSRRADGSRRTDGLVTLGGGARFAAGPHVFVRPDVRAQMVFSRDTRVLGLFTLSFGYRF